VVWVLAAVACGGPVAPAAPVVSEVRGEIFGSTWSAKWLPGATPVGEDAVAAAAAAVFADVDLAASTWRPDSELSRCRATPGGLAVGGDGARMVRLALELAAATDGAFDPTVQPLVELWGLHGERRTTWPTDAELAAARAAVDWRRVALTWRDGAPWLDCGGTALDLSALAPGYAADRLSDALSALGLADHLVDVGGELMARGRGPTGGPWRLGIDAPVEGLAPGEQLVARVALTDRAVATSGNYRNRYEVDGKAVWHELDPRTGLPAEERVLSAVVVATDAATADAWATALMVLGEPGLARLGAWPEVDALVMLDSPDGLVLRRSRGMNRWTTAGELSPSVSGVDGGGAGE
jgi:thiamine biosynthesis lipoprotein